MNGLLIYGGLLSTRTILHTNFRISLEFIFFDQIIASLVLTFLLRDVYELVIDNIAYPISKETLETQKSKKMKFLKFCENWENSINLEKRDTPD